MTSPPIHPIPNLRDLRATLKRFMAVHRLSQRQAARLLDVSQPLLSRLMAGRDIHYSAGAQILHLIQVETERRKLPLSTPIRDIRTQYGVFTLRPDDSLREAHGALNQREFSFAPLEEVREGMIRLGPVVSRDRIERALEDGVNGRELIRDHLAKLSVGEPAFVKDSDKVSALPELLEKYLLVIIKTSSGKPVGVITKWDLDLINYNEM